MQGVVVCCGRFRVGKAVQVPVSVGSQHDGRLLRCRKSSDLDVPCVGRHGVGDVADDLARESLLAVRVNNRESNRRLSVRNYSEVAPI
jgi:hypothetical protein